MLFGPASGPRMLLMPLFPVSAVLFVAGVLRLVWPV